MQMVIVASIIGLNCCPPTVDLLMEIIDHKKAWKSSAFTSAIQRDGTPGFPQFPQLLGFLGHSSAVARSVFSVTLQPTLQGDSACPGRAGDSR